MPRLPGEAAQLVVAQPRDRVVPGVRDPIAPAIANAGRNIAGASNELHAAFEQEQYRFDMSRTEDAYNQLIQGSIDLSVGDEGYQKQLGGDAINQPLLKNTMDRYDQLQQGISGGLDNPRQREEFSKRMDVQKGRMAQGVLSHQQTQNGVYRTQLLNATKITGANEAALTAYSMGAVDATVVRWKALVNEDAKFNGYDDEKSKVIREVKYLEGTTAIHEAVIETAINDGKTAYAKMWLDTHTTKEKNEIDVATADRLRAALEVSDTLETGQAVADAAVAKGMTKTEAIADARKRLSGADEREAVSQIKTRYAEMKQERLDFVKESNDVAASVMAQEGGLYEHIPPMVIANMDPDYRRRLRDYSAQKAGGFKPPKSSPTYYSLRQMNGLDPDNFVRLDLNKFDGVITTEEKKELIGKQEDIITGGDKAEIARSKEMIMKQGLVDSGLDPKELFKDSDEGREAGAFYRRIDAEVAALGRDVPPKELSEIVDRLAIEVTRKRSKENWFVDEDPAGLVSVEGVPDDQVDELAAAVQAAGQPVTHANIRKLYIFLGTR